MSNACAALLIAALLAAWACPVNAPDLTPMQEKIGGGQPDFLSSVHVADPRVQHQLIDGFYELENGSWRWVARRFVVALQPPGKRSETVFLRMRFYVPKAIAQRFSGTKILVKVNGMELGAESFAGDGAFLYSKEVPSSALGGEPARVEFELENAVPAGEIDLRELGVIVTSITLH